MGPELDLRDRPTEERRRGLFDALTEADVGETVDVTAAADVDVHLVRYQIERGRNLAWTYADPDAEPRRLTVTKGDPLDDGALGAIDVRDLKPQRRHQVLLAAFDELGGGEGFVLVNDHDPKPLYHELTSMHGDVVDWEYRTRGTDGWRVEIVKTGESNADDTGVVTRYDVREIPKAERHPTIHHRYGMIPEGGTIELIAPHEPRPLRGEFRQRYGDSFVWEVVEDEPGRCRVRVTKDVRSDEGDDRGEGTRGEGTCGEGTRGEGNDRDEGSDPTRKEDGIEVIEELDVRDLPPAQRHERIFETYADLESGTGFVLVNDHDPKPLYHQFTAEAGPAFRWEYRLKDPGEFRVLIGKSNATDAATDGAATDGAATDDVVADDGKPASGGSEAPF
ncbi:DUF2249 domain-containing protein [Halopenitus persicus]|uniref:DUF2249 domain-containing protein n=1 Tax=Halopenitus persicus TaxID=1048396 RepID=UPI000BBAA38C|nr:DUF2249 domain-containing protein [Halopenitus persicus]